MSEKHRSILADIPLSLSLIYMTVTCFKQELPYNLMMQEVLYTVLTLKNSHLSLLHLQCPIQGKE